MERKPYIWNELFLGDWNLFQTVFGNPDTKIFYDGDGILSDTPKVVLRKFTSDRGIPTNPAEIDKWDYLTQLAVNAGLSPVQIKHSEDDWYKIRVLYKATRYLYMRSAVERTIHYQGPQNNFVLTSREPYFKTSTHRWVKKQYPGIPEENVLIRGQSSIKPTLFKADNLAYYARTAPWVVLVDDSTKYIQAALDAGIPNLLAINIPLGKTMPEFKHDQLVVIKRYPEEIQAMYPFMNAVDMAIRNSR